MGRQMGMCRHRTPHDGVDQFRLKRSKICDTFSAVAQSGNCKLANPRVFVTDQVSDADIVRGLRAGDRCCWDALCDRYDQRLWHYLARLIGRDSAAVADVFQETMLAAARSGRRLDQTSTLWPWLAKIGHNQAALHWRRHYRDRESISDVDQLTAADCDDPAAILTNSETVESVRCLLAEMDAEYVALLAAKYIDDMSISEIVALFGGTTESVRSKLARARRDFRERYQRVAAQ